MLIVIGIVFFALFFKMEVLVFTLFLFYLFIYLIYFYFIILWLCWVFVVHVGSFIAACGLLSSCSGWSLECMGSVVVACGLSSCGELA